MIYAEKSLINLILLYTQDTQTHKMTERRLHDLAPSASAGPGDDMHWERNFIHQIKTLKSGSKDQLDSLTDFSNQRRFQKIQINRQHRFKILANDETEIQAIHDVRD